MKTVLTRDNSPVEEQIETAHKLFKGIEIKYEEVYYLDHEVDENNGKINRGKKVKHYTKEQIQRNLKALKSSYLLAIGK